jgi:hypothetical protein
MCRTIKCLSILCVSYFSCHVNLSFLFLWAMFWLLQQICVLSTIAIKYITKNWKKTPISSDFYAKQSYQFLNFSTDKLVISTTLSMISTNLSVKPVSAFLKFENQILNLILSDIYGFHDICRNRWPSIFGVISILWSLGGGSGAAGARAYFLFFM